MFSASSAERVYRCGASAALDGSVIETSEYAAIGTIVHDFVDICKTQSRAIALAKYETHEELRTLRLIPVDSLLADVTHIATEVAFAVNVFSREAMWLGHHLNRVYPPMSDGWICGSEDVVGLNGNLIPVVADIKNGDSVGPVEDNLQVGFHALAVSLLTGYNEVEGRIVYTRLPASEESYVFVGLDFEIVLNKLRIAFDNYRKAKTIVEAGGSPPVYPGDWCKYCPVINRCTKWTGLVRSFGAELEHTNFNSGAITPEYIAKIYPNYKQMKSYFSEFDDRLRALVLSMESIPLNNGKHLRLIPSSREYVDSKKAIALLRLYGASEEEIEDLYKRTKFLRLMECKEEK